MSSDEETFQECESGFDLDATPINPERTPLPAHSSNIDHHVFDKTINFSAIAANSTAGLVTLSTTTNLSQSAERSDILFKTSEADSTTVLDHTFERLSNQTIEMDESVPSDGVSPLPKNVQIEMPKESEERNEMIASGGIDVDEVQNQTISISDEMNVTSLVQVGIESDEVPSNVTHNEPIDVTIDGPEEMQKQNSSTTEMIGDENHSEICEQNQTIVMDKTQDLNDVPVNTVELNHTMDLPSSEEEITSTVTSEETNRTFVENDSGVIEPPMNVTVDVSICKNSSTQQFNEIDAEPEKCELQNQTMPLDVTPDLNDEPLNTVEMNQTIDLSSSKEVNFSSPAPLDGTFAKNASPAAFNVSHNASKDLLSSTRRSMDAVSTSTSSNKINLNETIIVDNKLPCMNTSFIVPPKPIETKPKLNDVDNGPMATPFNEFKLPAVPAVPSNASNFLDPKLKTQSFDISDDEFSSPGCKFLILILILILVLFLFLFGFFFIH